MVAETDFKNNGAGTMPSEVGWRGIPPMWTVLGQAFRGTNQNITFGMKVDHRHEEQRDPIARESRTLIVAFKAATILQDWA